MKVILLEDIKSLGKKEDIVEVNDGYARNFLIKKNKALEATPENLNSVRVKKNAAIERARREKEEAQALAKKMKDKTIVIKMKSGEGGKLYGAMTAMDVSTALEKQGYHVDKKNITIKTPIKSAGVYEIDVKLYTDVTTKIQVEIQTGT